MALSPALKKTFQPHSAFSKKPSDNGACKAFLGHTSSLVSAIEVFGGTVISESCLYSGLKHPLVHLDSCESPGSIILPALKFSLIINKHILINFLNNNFPTSILYLWILYWNFEIRNCNAFSKIIIKFCLLMNFEFCYL